jgi:hypothetical protein
MSAVIRSIVEDKVSAYLAANITDTTVVKGITDSLRAMPMIVVYASDAAKPSELGASNLGNYHVKLEVFVYSSADDDSLQSHRERVSKVHGLMSDLTALKALWSGSDGLLYAAWIESDEEGMHSRNYGNKVIYTLVAVLPPSPV